MEFCKKKCCRNFQSTTIQIAMEKLVLTRLGQKVSAVVFILCGKLSARLIKTEWDELSEFFISCNTETN